MAIDLDRERVVVAVGAARDVAAGVVHAAEAEANAEGEAPLRLWNPPGQLGGWGWTVVAGAAAAVVALRGRQAGDQQDTRARKGSS